MSSSSYALRLSFVFATIAGKFFSVNTSLPEFVTDGDVQNQGYLRCSIKEVVLIYFLKILYIMILKQSFNLWSTKDETLQNHIL